MLEPRSATGPGGSSVGHRRDVVERVGRRARPSLSPWPRWSKQTAASPRRAARARSRSGSPSASRRRAGSRRRRRVAVGQEERVGQPVAGAQLGRRLDVDGAHWRWASMPRADGRAATALATSIRSAAASPRPGTSSSAAATRSTLAREFGTPRLRRRRGRRARARAGLRRRLRRALRRTSRSTSPPRPSRARRCCASCARRAWRATSPPAASWRIALKAGFDPARIHLHGNAKSARRAAPRRSTAGVGHVVVDNHTDIDRLEQLVPDGRGAARAAARGARHQPRHAPVDLDRAGRTRSSASACSRRRAAIERLDAVATGSSSRACTCTSARRSTTLAPLPHGAGGDGRPRRLRTAWSTSAAASASPTSSAEHPPTIEDYVAAKVAAVARRHGPGRARSSTSRGARSSPTRPSRSTRCSRSSATSTLRRRRRRHVRQPAPDALRRALRGADRVALRAAGRTATWSASTASRAT